MHHSHVANWEVDMAKSPGMRTVRLGFARMTEDVDIHHDSLHPDSHVWTPGGESWTSTFLLWSDSVQCVVARQAREQHVCPQIAASALRLRSLLRPENAIECFGPVIRPIKLCSKTIDNAWPYLRLGSRIPHCKHVSLVHCVDTKLVVLNMATSSNDLGFLGCCMVTEILQRHILLCHHA